MAESIQVEGVWKVREKVDDCAVLSGHSFDEVRALLRKYERKYIRGAHEHLRLEYGYGDLCVFRERPENSDERIDRQEKEAADLRKKAVCLEKKRLMLQKRLLECEKLKKELGLE